jgi:hypothetical protein
MRLPFTAAEFFDTIRRYNEAVWPAQWGLYAVALAIIALSLRGGPRASRMVAGGLGLLWLWMGVAYHLTFFRTVNPAATIFGLLFVTQGAMFLWRAVRRRGQALRGRRDLGGVLGMSMLAYALVIYPLIGYALGQRYPAAPTFGLPCPTTILTFGVLLWAARPVPTSLLVIPALWALIATQAAFAFGVWQDLGLLASAVTTGAVLWWTRERPLDARPVVHAV